MKRLLALAAAALTFGAAQAQQPLAFVACPIMRDTATVPCWLAEYRGERYYLGAQDDADAENDPPALGHQALIEGAPTGETRCGGKVLANLHISIRPDRDPSCDAILPATDAYSITAPVQGPGPGGAAAAPAPAAGAAVNPALAGSKRFVVLYDFDWQTAGRQTRVIQEAVAYFRASRNASKVSVEGFRASVRLADGRVLVEQEGIALRRARELLETLVTLGVDRGSIVVVDNPDAEPGDYTRRRALIDVIRGGEGGVEDHAEH